MFVREVHDPHFGILYVFKNRTSGVPVFVQELDFDVLSVEDA